MSSSSLSEGPAGEALAPAKRRASRVPGLATTGVGWIGLDRWPQADARRAEELVVEDGGGHRAQLRLGGPLELGIGRAGKLRPSVFLPGDPVGSGGARARIGIRIIIGH